MSFLSELTAKKYWIISAIVLIGVLSALYFFVSFSNEAREEKLVDLNNSREEQLSEEKNTETNQNVSEPEVKYVVAGEITEIHGNLIYLKVDDILYELYPQIPIIRTIFTNQETEFIVILEKNEDFYEAELNEYYQALQRVSEEERENFPDPPSMYQQGGRAQLSDFQSGDYIIVISEGNILDQERIDAKKLIKKVQVESF